MAKCVRETYFIAIPSEATATWAVRRRVPEHLQANRFGEEDRGGIEVALGAALLDVSPSGESWWCAASRRPDE
jgi:hypothetical protein